MLRWFEAPLGAVNHLPIVQVNDLTEILTEMKSNHYSIIAASEKGESQLQDFDFPNKSGIIIGNEGVGIGQELIALSDHQISIRQEGTVNSLNAAVSASIMIYEYQRQQKIK